MAGFLDRRYDGKITMDGITIKVKTRDFKPQDLEGPWKWYGEYLNFGDKEPLEYIRRVAEIVLQSAPGSWEVDRAVNGFKAHLGLDQFHNDLANYRQMHRRQKGDARGQ